jgi:hypothetical protein
MPQRPGIAKGGNRFMRETLNDADKWRSMLMVADVTAGVPEHIDANSGV